MVEVTMGNNRNYDIMDLSADKQDNKSTRDTLVDDPRHVIVTINSDYPSRHRYITALKKLTWLLQYHFLQLHLQFCLNLVFSAYYSCPKRCLHIPKLAL